MKKNKGVILNLETILNVVICAGVLMAKIIIGVVNESYWYKWERVRLEFNKLFCRRKRQAEEIKVPRSRKKSLEDYLP